MALFLMCRTRFDEARDVLERAREIDPLAASVNMISAGCTWPRDARSSRFPCCRPATELSPQFALAHEQLGLAWLQLDAEDEALAAFRRVASLSGPRGATRLAWALAATGDQAGARNCGGGREAQTRTRMRSASP